jgi:hypothetical protein
LAKREQFLLFERLGLRCPPHGSAGELQQRLAASPGGLGDLPAASREVRAIVYLDQHAHRGEGKALLSLDEAAQSHADHYASLHVPSASEAPVALRHARLGRLTFWIRQQGSRQDWRSNRHEQEEVLAAGVSAEPNPIERVLWAIDFIPSPFGLLAVDFNTAPDLDVLGEAGVLTPSAVAEELERCAASVPAHLNQF